MPSICEFAGSIPSQAKKNNSRLFEAHRGSEKTTLVRQPRPAACLSTWSSGSRGCAQVERSLSWVCGAGQLAPPPQDGPSHFPCLPRLPRAPSRPGVCACAFLEPPGRVLLVCSIPTTPNLGSFCRDPPRAVSLSPEGASLVFPATSLLGGAPSAPPGVWACFPVGL